MRHPACVSMGRIPRAIFAALLSLPACGGGQMRSAEFSVDWQDDRGLSIGRIWAQTATMTAPASADVVVGIAEPGDRIVALSLTSGNKWAFAHPLAARPVVAGPLVVASGGGETFAVDASDGHLVWKTPTSSLALVGAGDDGAVTVVTLRPPGENSSVLLAVARSGEVLVRIDTDKGLGIPAVFGHKAFVPWAGQYVSVVDLASGDEEARVTLRHQTSRAWTEGGSLWFGELGFTRFDESIHGASAGKASFADLPPKELPGGPKLMPRGAVPLPTVANAQDRVRLYARPAATSSGAALADDRWYATYFRLAMGFDAAGGKLAWVHVHGADVLGAAAGSGGVVLCDEQGNVTSLDARTGGVVSKASLGEPVRACVVNIDAQHFEDAPASAPPLVDQLEAALSTDDPQLVEMQQVLLRELSPMQEPSATKTLLTLASDVRTPPDLRKDARVALAKRTSGGADLLDALHRHYDYLGDVLLAPPVGPIAAALAGMKDPAAAPLLAAHLLDPETPLADLAQLSEALGALAGPAEAPALRQFFAMYRANAEAEELVAAVVRTGQTLRALRDKLGAAEVEEAANDPLTMPEIREALSAGTP
jgi:outer membrane protein assembly factor BamB